MIDFRIRKIYLCLAVSHSSWRERMG